MRRQVDFISLILFYYQRKAIFTTTTEEDICRDVMCVVINEGDEDAPATTRPRFSSTGRAVSRALSVGSTHAPHKGHIDINMAGALTHVGGDTMRTAAVFIAAVITTTTPITGAQCDAWATIVVTISIVALVIPLIGEIVKAYFDDMAEEDVIIYERVVNDTVI